MATQTIKTGDNADIVKVGTVNWDASDSYNIWTYGGSDTLDLHSDGALWVDAGTGDDTVDVGGSGTATIYGGAGNDSLTHYKNSLIDSVVKFYGGDGNDYINGGDGTADFQIDVMNHTSLAGTDFVL